MVKYKRVRWGLKFQGRFFELVSLRRSKDSIIIFLPHMGKHITVLNEGVSVSSHVTDEIRDTREHLGRLVKDIPEDEDDLAEKMYRPRKINEDEYAKKVIFLHKDWFEFTNEELTRLKTQETDTETIYYIDLNEVFDTAQKFFERFADDPSRLMWLGQAGDILNDEELEYAITEEEKIIIEIYGELYELDFSSLKKIDEDSPLAEYLRPIGVLELMKNVESKYDDIAKELLESSGDGALAQSTSGTPPPPPANIQCSKCGAWNRHGLRYCNQCGHELNDS